MQWAPLFLLLGISFMLWMAIGALRFVQQRHSSRNGRSGDNSGEREDLSPEDVAVIIPAHNEKLTIGATLHSALRLVPPGNIHVIADGCGDSTTAVAHKYGANILVISPAGGKAAGIEAVVKHFDLCQKFAVVLILDADTQLDENYIERGLALLNDPAMGAVAGYAHTTWRPEQLTLIGRLLVSYRTRLYAVMQWIKYGQTWRYTNVTPIVPGFASMYRTKALAQMDINPPGLVIEDFNMTFELHRKRLGKIAFEPSVFGRTQDPDNVRDYYRQVTRWWLGFWQTLRRHGLWWSLFSATLCLFLLEIVTASLALLLVALAIMLLAAGALSGGPILAVSWYSSLYALLSDLLAPMNLLLFLFVPDYALTCVVAIWMRRPSLLVYGLGFLFIRLLDATAALWTLLQTWRAKSTGRWNSPRRRVVAVATPRRDAKPAGSTAPAGAPSTLADPADEGDRPGRARWVHPVLRDTLLLSALLAATTWIVVVAVPLPVVITGVVLLMAVATKWHRRK